jgi:general secretion pathway protein C
MFHSDLFLMAISQSANFISKLAAIALGLCLVGILAFWASKLLAPRVAIAPIVVSAPPTDNQESAFTKQLFGNPPVATATNNAPVDSRLQVLGVIASASGVAVLSIDGAAAKPFSVGQTIAQGVVLTQVRADKVVIKRDGVEQTLPTPIPPNKSILTVGKSAPSGSPASAYPPVMGASNANQTLTGVGGQPQNTQNSSQPAQMQSSQSPNPPFSNGPVQQTPTFGDQGVQNSPQINNNGQPNPVGSSMRSGSPQ